jgi:hypothetical protein
MRATQYSAARNILSDDVSALPRAHSVSLYVARHRMDDPGRGWQGGLKSLVLGTPFMSNKPNSNPALVPRP